jgi:hypothetical protein
VLSIDGVQVRGRLVRFWRGDSVLELETGGPNGDGTEKKVRLSQRPETDRDAIAFYLLDQVVRTQDLPPASGR